MRKNKFISTLVLMPLSKIYGMIVGIRNRMFDIGLLKQREFDVPVVVIGNIAVGGTGKTPHTEFIIDALRNSYHIGVLSRGYKRHSKGFVLATNRTTPYDIGDEPYQVFRKYGNDVTVAVCEDRCKGIDEMLRINNNIDLILLDDAFQHRYVKPKVSIVLTEFNRPIFHDKLLPLGRLRESRYALNRTDMVIVTKCPDEVKPMDYRIYKNNLNLYPYQKLFYSRYSYGNLVSVFPDKVTYIPFLEWLTETDSILLVTGIANPRPLIKHLRKQRAKLKLKLFPDHHNFTKADIKSITERYDSLSGKHKYIITTEKDAVRLSNNPYIPQHLKPVIFYMPIKVQFLLQSSETFVDTLNKLIRSENNVKH
ncbi:MAG: tetraacyldisaccharide 4'-kinase [Muribaculaceae bacterium]|nr:tetraacyldisaccharide 4'-kinase [Muribaculaceae bacterium]